MQTRHKTRVSSVSYDIAIRRDFGPKPKILPIIIFTFPAVVSEYLAKRHERKMSNVDIKISLNSF